MRGKVVLGPGTTWKVSPRQDQIVTEDWRPLDLQDILLSKVSETYQKLCLPVHRRALCLTFLGLPRWLRTSLASYLGLLMQSCPIWSWQLSSRWPSSLQSLSKPLLHSRREWSFICPVYIRHNVSTLVFQNWYLNLKSHQDTMFKRLPSNRLNHLTVRYQSILIAEEGQFESLCWLLKFLMYLQLLFLIQSYFFRIYIAIVWTEVETGNVLKVLVSYLVDNKMVARLMVFR